MLLQSLYYADNYNTYSYGDLAVELNSRVAIKI